MNVRPLVSDDVPALWRINEEGVPGVGRITEAQMGRLLSLTHLALGAFEDEVLLGFVLCLRPGTPYGSPNYAWFSDNYPECLYVDRIAVAATRRSQRLGSLLYERVIACGDAGGWPVAAEVNLKPPNPGSMRFHERNGFVQVGSLDHPYGSVAMVLRPISVDGPRHV